jgi:hypothetical protein
LALAFMHYVDTVSRFFGSGTRISTGTFYLFPFLADTDVYFGDIGLLS